MNNPASPLPQGLSPAPRHSFRFIFIMLVAEFRILNVVSRRVWPQSSCAFMRLAISLLDPDGVAFQSQGQGPWVEMASQEAEPERVESRPSSHIGNGSPSGCIFLSDSLVPGLRPGLSSGSPSGCGKLSNGSPTGCGKLKRYFFRQQKHVGRGWESMQVHRLRVSE